MRQTSAALQKIRDDVKSLAVYDELLRRVKRIGEHEVEVKDTSIHIVHGRAFLGIHPRKDGLRLTIVLNRPLQNPRIKRSEQVSRNRYHHEIFIDTPEAIDRELAVWIGEAYGLTAE